MKVSRRGSPFSSKKSPWSTPALKEMVENPPPRGVPLKGTGRVLGPPENGDEKKWVRCELNIDGGQTKVRGNPECDHKKDNHGGRPDCCKGKRKQDKN